MIAYTCAGQAHILPPCALTKGGGWTTTGRAPPGWPIVGRRPAVGRGGWGLGQLQPPHSQVQPVAREVSECTSRSVSQVLE
jgi:hypothetical protein